MVHTIRRFPHLLRVDTPLWLRFLDQFGDTYERFEYDVRVGKGRPVEGFYPESIQKMALDLSLRRIDAVGHRPGEIHIIEITRRAGVHAVGQLTSYPILYRETFMPSRPVIPLLVAEELNPDVETVLKENAIPYILLPSEE